MLSALTNLGFETNQPSQQPSPLFHLACFRAYASSVLLPAHLQGSIPGLGLAVSRAGFPPAWMYDIAMSLRFAPTRRPRLSTARSDRLLIWAADAHPQLRNKPNRS